MKHHIIVRQIEFYKNRMKLSISGVVECNLENVEYIPKPKLILVFKNGEEDRRIPFVYTKQEKKDGKFYFDGQYDYMLEHLFWDRKKGQNKMEMTMALSCGNEYDEQIEVDYIKTKVIKKESPYKYLIVGNVLHIEKEENGRNLSDKLCKIRDIILGVLLFPIFILEGAAIALGIIEGENTNKKALKYVIKYANDRFEKITDFRISFQELFKIKFKFIFSLYKKEEIIPNRVTFISQRRENISGNFEFVYNQLKDNPDLEIKFILSTKTPKKMSIKEIREFYHACAVSKTIVLDEFTPMIHYVNLKEETKVIQLWHACGAFKTFGFTRLGKPQGSPQKTKMHRNYDYVTVSSTFCKRCHSEGFGIATDKVIPTGIPRTDVFFSDSHRNKVQTAFFEKYPLCIGKKIILFAPTFRGMIKETAFYPVQRFEINKVLKALGEEYVIIIKHHPFVKERHVIPEEYKDRVIDLSDSVELNDLMFVSDLVITDYSSLIFEAALLKIPMLFYVFDLEEYIEERDFYFDLKLMSPGKLVYTQEELIDSILNKDYCLDKLEEFTELFFDDLDGQASKRVAELILSTLK